MDWRLATPGPAWNFDTSEPSRSISLCSPDVFFVQPGDGPVVETPGAGAFLCREPISGDRGDMAGATRSGRPCLNLFWPVGTTARTHGLWTPATTASPRRLSWAGGGGRRPSCTFCGVIERRGGDWVTSGS